jgi:hypothetical protein
MLSSNLCLSLSGGHWINDREPALSKVPKYVRTFPYLHLVKETYLVYETFCLLQDAGWWKMIEIRVIFIVTNPRLIYHLRIINVDLNRVPSSGLKHIVVQ